MTILVVDDDPMLLALLRDFLRQYGHDVETATDGAEALRQMAACRPHLVISDIEMPGMNGLALLKAILVRYPWIPVLMMTGGDPGLLSIANRNGAFACLLKPFKLSTLLAYVACITSKKDAHRAQAGFPGRKWMQ